MVGEVRAVALAEPGLHCQRLQHGHLRTLGNRFTMEDLEVEGFSVKNVKEISIIGSVTSLFVCFAVNGKKY